MSRRGRIVAKVVVWGACLTPLACLVYWFATDDLTPDPIAFVTHTLGDWTLRILLASLAMTPLRILFGLSWPIALRRLLGLFAFVYACLHFSVWIVLDFFFDWPRMWADILERPYITLGMLALLSLLPLALTSTSGWIKRLGARAWTRLHRLAYLAAVLACLHFIWLAKVGRTDQYWHAVALAVLLGVRLVSAAVRFARKRRRSASTVPA